MPKVRRAFSKRSTQPIMPKKPKPDNQPSLPPPDDTLSWSAWPLALRPMPSGALILFILAVSLYSYVTFHHAVYAVIALVVLTGAVSDYLFPTSYRIDPEGITIRAPFQTRRIKWDDFKFYAVGDGVIILCNTLEIDRATVRRNPWLRVPENADQVAAILARRLENLRDARKRQSSEDGANG